MNDSKKITYYEKKMIDSIIFRSENSKFEGLDIVFNIKNLEKLKLLINYYTSLNALDYDAKENINQLLIEGRNIKDDDYEERIDLINEIIILINSQKEDDSINFYRDLLYDRFQSKKILSFSDEYIESKKEEIRYLMYYDLLILSSHSSNVSDDDFTNIWIDYFKCDEIYYLCISYILYQNPHVFEDSKFKIRMNAILEENENINSKNKKINKELKKGIEYNLNNL
ncbi:MAG: hypothetical protein Q4E75_00005 [bacterium]|nr:hypothetical protein [bacterium]